MNGNIKMADGEVKEMKTIIFFSMSMEDHLKSIETLVDGLNADERCEHKICFRPITINMFQFLRGEKDTQTDAMSPIGCHEILYLPVNREADIARLEATKNVVLKINCMCFVGDNDKKKLKLKKIIDWLLEEVEDIRL